MGVTHLTGWAQSFGDDKDYGFCLMQGEFGKEEDSYCKRKCRSWGIQRVEEESGFFGGFRVIGGEEEEEEEEENKTLELFPLHPEGR